MEFTVKQPELLAELEILQGVVERKNTVPILANVLIGATAEGIDLVATDLEVSVRTRAEAAVKKEGSVCVSAKKLYEIVRLLPDADVTVKDDEEHWVTVTCERSRFRIMGLSREDFPNLPAALKTTKTRIPGRLLSRMVSRVIFAVTSDESRFALNGALMLLKGPGVSFVASDGHRLAHVSGALEGKAADVEERVLIPRKALAEVGRLASAAGEDVFYCRKENHLFFEVGKRQLSSRILEGTFPNFEKVVPTGNDKILDFDTRDLTTALNRVSLLANEKSRAVRMSLKGGRAEISSRNPEMGDASETFAVDYQGPEIDVGFNAKYLLEFLGAVGTEKVTVELKDDVTQGLLRPSGEGAKEYTYVVMPMRI